MSDWDVHLVFIDDKSKKFWRARVDGSDLLFNWGRIGSDGQQKQKTFADAAAAAAERDSVAGSKRRKGYVDQGPANDAGATNEAEESVLNEVSLSLEHDGRTIEVRLEVDDNRLRTVVVEQHKSGDDARATLARIKKALEADGYR